MKIAIAGYGVEGKANYDYWSKVPDAELTIVDEAEYNLAVLPQGVSTILGQGAFRQLEGFDLVIRTAGLAPRKIKTDGKIWSGTNEFFEKCPAQIIGVTGSKGKGTTSSMIAAILEADGKKVWLLGNIGLPGLEVLDQIQPEDFVVYELSSFQLWDLERSPHTAVVLFIEQEHLDVHESMEEYVNAKAQIALHQTADDRLIYNKDNQYAKMISEYSAGQVEPYPVAETAHVVEDTFYYGEQLLCSTSVLYLKAKHNVENATAAIDAVWPLLTDIASIERGLGVFKGLPHRLAYVATVNDVDYYDDSIATTPGSAIAALRAFDKPKIIILGGSFKGSDFTELANEMFQHDATALLIGEEAPRIAAAFDVVGFRRYEQLEVTKMSKIVDRAAKRAQPGSVVLLSPAAASFGLFKNYSDRGEQFIEAVSQLPQ